MRHTIFNIIIPKFFKYQVVAHVIRYLIFWDIIFSNDVRYQMATCVIRYLILLIQGFLYQVAACFTRYL